MNKTTTMNLRMDVSTRQQLKGFAAQLGIPASSLVNGLIREALRTRKVTFSTGLKPTTYLEEAISKAEADYKTGRNITTTKTDKETLDYLRSL